MAQTTRQRQRTSGGDVALGSNTSRTSGTSTRTTTPKRQVSKNVGAPVTTTRTIAGTTKTTTENNFGQTTLTQEDFSFTLSFNVKIKSPLPCKEQE